MRTAACLALAALALLPRPAFAADPVADVVQRVRDSTVVVRVPNVQAAGSGVIVDAKGIVVTAAQWVQNTLRADVEIAGKTYPAKVILAQSLADLALLQIEQPPQGLKAVPLADSEAIALGEQVIVVSGPVTGSNRLVVGFVTGRSSGRILHGGLGVADLLETDAAARPGNAGAPVFGTNGAMVGMVSGISAPGSTLRGFGYVVGASTIRRLLTDDVPWAGVEALFLSPETAGLLNIPQPGALLVQRVVPGSDAEKLGLRGGSVEATISGDRLVIGGDVVLEIGGVKLSDPEAGTKIRAKMRAARGSNTIVVLRRGERVELRPQPQPQPQPQ